MINMNEPNINSKNRERLGMNVISEILPQQSVGTKEIESSKLKEQQILHKFTNDELTLDDLDIVLSTTVFEDKNVKIPLFLVSLLTFTDEEQRNVVLTGESSLGKTYNIKECLWYFRQENSERILEISDATARALIHSPNSIFVDDRTLEPIDNSKVPKKGDAKEIWEEWNELRRHKASFLDLSNKIVAFYDLKNYDLLQNLRSLLSHDNVISTHLITDKSSSEGHRTKKVLIKGYFTAIFGSAYGEMDEQEISRNYLLTPNDTPDKIAKAIEFQSKKMSDPNFKNWYETEPSRLGLKKRVKIIEEAKIKKILFKPEEIENLKDWFMLNIENLAPKAQRDFPRLYALAEAWAMLNFMNREKTPEGDCVYANITDIEVAEKIYEPILRCNALGLTPEEFEVWKMIEKTFNEDKNYIETGLKISEIHNIYYYEKKRRCSDKRLRGMLKNFCCAGLLKEEKEGQTIKYCPITHKVIEQSQLKTQEDTPTKQIL
jgi:hypothetical protein